jgi:hypothetical protein
MLPGTVGCQIGRAVEESMLYFREGVKKMCSKSEYATRGKDVAFVASSHVMKTLSGRLELPGSSSSRPFKVFIT